ncbi:predicted protein [Nematostella vectensis]|uniref:Uncharacterized protein n=1 Tax=Nematostella vectensis TaxID=45351 RepID=A7SYR8_NEMVE|nr:predicted protein [Nematostella vectensis]|eukprot:XP_001623256.1 predicted protein [Nematostella vectensis]
MKVERAVEMVDRNIKKLEAKLREKLSENNEMNDVPEDLPDYQQMNLLPDNDDHEDDDNDVDDDDDNDDNGWRGGDELLKDPSPAPLKPKDQSTVTKPASSPTPTKESIDGPPADAEPAVSDAEQEYEEHWPSHNSDESHADTEVSSGNQATESDVTDEQDDEEEKESNALPEMV